MHIRALIIDDEQLAREELKYLLDSIGGVDVVAQGANGIEAVSLIEMHSPDLVFLDVQMPGLDGFAAIERVMARSKAGRSGPMPQIVFATAYDQYAVRAFEVNAIDYLLKPFDRTRVAASVERVRALLDTRAQAPEPAPPPLDSQIESLLALLKNPLPARPSRIVVEVQNRLLLVDQAEICFAAIDDGVIRIATRTFEGCSRCRTLEELMEQLDPAHFWRAHRGYVVNIGHIREVVPWFKSSYQLRMDDKQQTEIPVSRAQTKRLKELFFL